MYVHRQIYCVPIRAVQRGLRLKNGDQSLGVLICQDITCQKHVFARKANHSVAGHHSCKISSDSRHWWSAHKAKKRRSLNISAKYEYKNGKGLQQLPTAPAQATFSPVNDAILNDIVILAEDFYWDCFLLNNEVCVLEVSAVAVVNMWQLSTNWCLEPCLKCFSEDDAFKKRAEIAFIERHCQSFARAQGEQAFKKAVGRLRRAGRLLSNWRHDHRHWLRSNRRRNQKCLSKTLIVCCLRNKSVSSLCRLF